MSAKQRAKRAKKGGDGGGGDANAWMVTFSDLLMLMLTFFVLLLTMSSLDSQSVKEAMRSGLHVTSTPAAGARVVVFEPIVAQNRLIDRAARKIKIVLDNDDPDGKVLEEVVEEVEDILRVHTDEGEIVIERRPDGLVIDLSAEIAFEPGSHQLRDEARPLLADLAELVRVVGSNASIEAHVPPGVAGSHAWEPWELALRRADRCARLFVALNVPGDRLQISGIAQDVEPTPWFVDLIAPSETVRTKEILRVKLFAGPSDAIADDIP